MNQSQLKRRNTVRVRVTEVFLLRVMHLYASLFSAEQGWLFTHKQPHTLKHMTRKACRSESLPPTCSMWRRAAVSQEERKHRQVSGSRTDSVWLNKTTIMSQIWMHCNTSDWHQSAVSYTTGSPSLISLSSTCAHSVYQSAVVQTLSNEAQTVNFLLSQQNKERKCNTCSMLPTDSGSAGWSDSRR